MSWTSLKRLKGSQSYVRDPLLSTWHRLKTKEWMLEYYLPKLFFHEKYLQEKSNSSFFYIHEFISQLSTCEQKTFEKILKIVEKDNKKREQKMKERMHKEWVKKLKKK